MLWQFVFSKVDRLIMYDDKKLGVYECGSDNQHQYPPGTFQFTWW